MTETFDDEWDDELDESWGDAMHWAPPRVAPPPPPRRNRRVMLSVDGERHDEHHNAAWGHLEPAPEVRGEG